MSRNEKVSEEIRKEVSLMIHEKLHDPRLGFITITRVTLTPDLRFARIFFSVYGNEQQWSDTQAALEHASGFMRRILGERLGLRFVPEIVFQSDHSAEYSILIEKQLEEIKVLQHPSPQRKVTKHGSKKTPRRTKKKTK